MNEVFEEVTVIKQKPGHKIIDDDEALKHAHALTDGQISFIVIVGGERPKAIRYLKDGTIEEKAKDSIDLSIALYNTSVSPVFSISADVQVSSEMESMSRLVMNAFGLR